MNTKIDPDTTSDIKLLKLYTLLLGSRKGLSTTEITNRLKCSKQTVGRLFLKLESIFPQYARIEKEGRSIRYFIDGKDDLEFCMIDAEGLKKLALLRDLFYSFLPDDEMDTIDQAILTTSSYSKIKNAVNDYHQNEIGSRIPKGKIDYNLVASQFETAQQSIYKKKCCSITYKANESCKTHIFAPKKILAYSEALYLVGWILDDSGKVKHSVKDPVKLAIHRIKDIQILDRSSEGYRDVLQFQTDSFGLMNYEEFTVRIRFKKRIATYISERIWSKNQKIITENDGSVILEFISSSKSEVASFILSFGMDAEVLEPEDLRNEIIKNAELMLKQYSSK